MLFIKKQVLSCLRPVSYTHLEKNVIFSSFNEENLKHLRKISHGEIIISGSIEKTKEVVYSSYFGYDGFKKFNTHAMMIPRFERCV